MTKGYAERNPLDFQRTFGSEGACGEHLARQRREQRTIRPSRPGLCLNWDNHVWGPHLSSRIEQQELGAKSIGIFLNKKGLQNLSKNTGKPIAEIVTKGGVFEDPGNEDDGKYVRYKYANLIHLYIEQLATTKDSMTGQYLDGLPHYEPPKFADDTPIAAVDEREYPFQLITYKMAWHAQARTATVPWLMLIQPENFVEESAADARRLGIRNGDAVRLTSATGPGGVVGKAKVTEGLRPGVIAVSHHFGHWELAARSHVVDGVTQEADPGRGTGLTVNPIMRLDQLKGRVLNTSIQDKVGGSVSFYDSRVRLVKA